MAIWERRAAAHTHTHILVPTFYSAFKPFRELNSIFNLMPQS